MSVRPMTIRRSGPAFEAKTSGDGTDPDRGANEQAESPVIEITAHPEDGGHLVGWYPATPDGLILAGGEFARLREYGFRHPPICTILGRIIPQDRIEIAVVVPFCRSEARRRAAALLRSFGRD